MEISAKFIVSLVKPKWFTFCLPHTILTSIAVFSHLESDAESNRCDETMQTVRNQKGEFGNNYFYYFGLNVKLCKGIRNYKAGLSEKELAKQARKHMLNNL
mgnify:CR=1 FL=1